MFELIEIVAPKVMAEWESVAYCMRYTSSEVTAFKKDAKDLKERCRNLFGNWLTTSHGPKPKTYQTLLKHIKKVYNLRTASGAIEKDLIEALSDGIRMYIHYCYMYWLNPTTIRISLILHKAKAKRRMSIFIKDILQ